MEPIEWLPNRPLSVAEALNYRRNTGVHECAPILGVNPDPADTVVFLYVGIQSATLLTAFDPDTSTWVRIDSGPARELLPVIEGSIRSGMEFIESVYPDETFTAFQARYPELN